MMQDLNDVIVIGSGPAGLTAAIYCARGGKKTKLITGNLIGGQLATTTHIENYPGFADPILGPDLMDAMYAQAKNMGVEMVQNLAQKIEKNDDIFSVECYELTLHAKTIIIATGANPKWLGNEGHLMGYGISTCATCDGAFFKNKEVAIIGGGNSAMEEALYLSNIASKVYMIHRRTAFRGEEIMQKRVHDVAQTKKIEILWPYIVKQFIGEKTLTHLKLEHPESNEIKEIAVSGAFIAIGHTPNTSFLKNLFELDENHYVKPGQSIEGLEFAGDVDDQQYRQAVTAAGFGCAAAIRTIAYLNKQN